jgi:predicted secreted Zn-dependent protease
VFGVILGGIGVASSAVALSNDKKAEEKHDAIIKTNALTLEQAATLKSNFEADLAKVNDDIAKVQAQIDDYNAAQLKALTAK